MIIMKKQKLKEQQFISIRTEHFLDNAGVIINNMNQYPFSIWSYSGNFDWHLNNNILWRIECKWMESNKPAFIQQDGNYKTSNFSSTTALCFSF